MSKRYNATRGYRDPVGRIATREADGVWTDEDVQDLRASLGPVDPRPTTVYYLHTADHELLYVGISLSRNGLQRFNGGHRHDKQWWSQVAYASMEHFDTRQEAQAREAYAIRKLNPRYNVRRPAEGFTRVTEYGVRTCSSGCGAAAMYGDTRMCRRCLKRRSRERQADACATTPPTFT